MPYLPLTFELEAVLRMAVAYGHCRMNSSLPVWKALRLSVSLKLMACLGM